MNDYSYELGRIARELREADAVLIGAGAGMSAAAGFAYAGARFEQHFADFKQAYGIADMYSGGFYPFQTPEELWAWWSRQVFINRYDVTVGEPYAVLRELVDGRNYFVLTTNVDHQFQLAGFDKQRLFYTQGDYGLWQCEKACHPKTYDNEREIRQMIARQQGMRIPSELVPHCPICGAPMTMNLRRDDHFVEDAGWHQAQARYEAFLQAHEGQRMLFLELGVGLNTPGIIKLPFWQMTYDDPRATYACINLEEAFCPKEIEKQSACVQADIAWALRELHRLM